MRRAETGSPILCIPCSAAGSWRRIPIGRPGSRAQPVDFWRIIACRGKSFFRQPPMSRWHWAPAASFMALIVAL